MLCVALVCVCLHIVMSTTYCVVFFVLFVIVMCLVYPMLVVSLGCPFLITPSVFSNVYLFHLSSSCVLYN